MVGSWRATNGKGEDLWSGSYDKFGDRSGHWIVHGPYGISEGDYAVTGKIGTWTERHNRSGIIYRASGEYRKGIAQGDWYLYQDDTQRMIETYKDGNVTDAKIFCPSGIVFTTSNDANGKFRQAVITRQGHELWRTTAEHQMKPPAALAEEVTEKCFAGKLPPGF